MFMEQLSFCRKNSQLNVLVSKRFPSDNELMVAVEQRITDGPWGERAPGSWLMPWAAEHCTSGLWMVQSQGSASSLGTILVIAVRALYASTLSLGRDLQLLSLRCRLKSFCCFHLGCILLLLNYFASLLCLFYLCFRFCVQEQTIGAGVLKRLLL